MIVEDMGAPFRIAPGSSRELFSRENVYGYEMGVVLVGIVGLSRCFQEPDGMMDRRKP